VAVDYSLYLVTDRDILGEGRDLIQAVCDAVRGGVTLVQLREKRLSSRDFYNLALALKKKLVSMNVPLIINDRLDIALAIDADGLHVGQEDLPVNIARSLMGPEKIVGLSVNTLEQAREGEQAGASYLGIGPVFYTQTKTDIDEPVGVEKLKLFKKNTSIPLVAIGGINLNNLEDVKQTGMDGVAIVSGLMAAQDVTGAAREMINIWKKN